MNISYKHKATGYVIPLEDIKRNKDKAIFIKTGTNNHGNYISTVTGIKYNAKDIPLSDDFEIIVKGNNEFSTDELRTILDIIYRSPDIDYSVAHNIKQKVKKLLYEKQKLEE
jgi:hypothetical protein